MTTPTTFDQAEYEAALARLIELRRNRPPRAETQYGVMRDLRERGHGIRLEFTTTSIKAAQVRAAQLEQQGMKTFIEQRLVVTFPWEPLTDAATDTAA